MFCKFQSIPKKVEAVRLTHENKDQVFNELTGQVATGFDDGEPIIKVTTVHGEIAIVRVGDWIVKERKAGYYYPVKHEVFSVDYIYNRRNRGGASAAN